MTSLAVGGLVTAIALLAIRAPALAAQRTCPVADSVLGPPAHEWLRIQSDTFTDSTSATTLTEGEINTMSIAGDAAIGFRAAAAGHALGTPAPLSVMTAVLVTADARGGAVGAPTPVTTGMATDQAVTPADLLVDDSLRLTLPVQSYAARIQPADAVAPAMLLETLTFAAPLPALEQLGRARSAKIRIGTLQKTFHATTLRSVRALARYLLCSPTPRR